jgi:5'-methylthioadenosine phosphorylase
VCGELASLAVASAKAVGASVHGAGTYGCLEGPAFSTLAESTAYRAWGFDIIGMTNLQEAKLAREAEICYTTIALVTDYDCWHPEHDSVTVEMIIANLVANASTAQRIIAEAVGWMPAARGCRCGRALEHAIITRPEHVPDAVKQALAPIIGKYFPTS